MIAARRCGGFIATRGRVTVRVETASRRFKFTRQSSHTLLSCASALHSPQAIAGQAAMNAMSTSISFFALDYHRYDRLCIVLTPIFIASQYLLFLYIHRVIRWRPPLTKDAIAAASGSGHTTMTEAGWRNFSIEATQLIWSGFFNTAYGSAAFAAVQSYVDVEPIRALGDHGALLAAGDIDYLMLQESAAFLGSVFGALMLFYLFYWCIGWDKGNEQLFHHVTFFGVTIVLARRSALPYSGLWAMAMEFSSPALNAMNLVRQLDGSIAEKSTLLCFAIFALSFYALRCVLFGKAVIRTCYLRMFAPDGFPVHVPAWEVDAVVLLWLAGWLLQLKWGVDIYKKVKRKFSKPKPKSE